MEPWILSGKISSQAREYGKTLCVPGARIVDIADKVEQKIIALGGKPAFPVDISLNTMAAHYCPFVDDPVIVQKGDLLKLDLGTHIEGHVTDTAVTIEVGGVDKYKKMREAVTAALKAAIDVVSPGVQVGKIGAAVEEVITGYGYNPIRNLCGHGVGLWEVHTKPTIPNYDNKDPTKLTEGQRIAIEPFVTDGEGMIKEGKPSGIYALINPKPVRLDGARKMIQHIMKEWKTLPFTVRWLKQFPNYQFLLNYLEKEQVISQYGQLPEKSGGLVTQEEHTIMVGTGVLTK
ncbi:type II methionyl aminopeptidase [Candidatus Woesearchaeota archaeon]|nr:type II methionyl aminopeptidase [Candidatus Woesearchaeota archaeon]